MEGLRALLAARGYAPPYVLVGHSLGGGYMELFAKAHPEEVTGVVLVDPRHRDFTTACADRRRMQRFEDGARPRARCARSVRLRKGRLHRRHAPLDLVLDVGGNTALARLRRALTPSGRLVFVGGENGSDWTAGFGRPLSAVLLGLFVKQARASARRRRERMCVMFVTIVGIRVVEAPPARSGAVGRRMIATGAAALSSPEHVSGH